MIFVDGAKGEAALHLERMFDAQHKTCFVMLHKLREAIAAEIDGANFGGYVKPENLVKDRVNRSLRENQSGKRQAVIVMRERNGRTLPFVVKHESQGAETVRERVKPGSTIHADEAPWWHDIEYDDRFDTKRVNHDQDGRSFEGACTNSAEGYLFPLEASRDRHPSSHRRTLPRRLCQGDRVARGRATHPERGTQFKLVVQAAATHLESQRWWANVNAGSVPPRQIRPALPRTRPLAPGSLLPPCTRRCGPASWLGAPLVPDRLCAASPRARHRRRRRGRLSASPCQQSHGSSLPVPTQPPSGRGAWARCA